MSGRVDPPCQAVWAGTDQPGAIAILQLIGEVEPLLSALTAIKVWPPGRVRLVSMAGIDRGIVVRVSDQVALLMPHGGPRVRQRLSDWMHSQGVIVDGSSNHAPCDLFPEAADEFEALALFAVSRAASPMAVDLLLDQPHRWRSAPHLTDGDRARSRRLNRLVDPPLVVVAGRSNVGKSTLSNRLLGRPMSIAADSPGTTRDYTAARINLNGLVVHWIDTPGLRDSGDPIEQRAIEIAARLIERADLLLAVTDHEHDWPRLSRPADLRVANKSDLARRGDGDLAISALTGEGIERLVITLREHLVSAAALTHAGPWLFDQRLEQAAANPGIMLGARGPH